MTSRLPRADGVVKVRLSGDLAALAALAALLASSPAAELLTGPDGPYPNRRDAGGRVYLTVGIIIPPSAGAGAPPPGNPPVPAIPPRRRALLS